MLLHGLGGVAARIRRAGDDADAFLLEPRPRLLERSQLLLAVRSPVGAIEKDDPPSPSRCDTGARAAEPAPQIELDAAEDLETTILERVSARARSAGGVEGGDLVVLQPLDLRPERPEDQVHEAHHARLPAAWVDPEAPDVALELGRRGEGVANRPQIQRRQSLRPSVARHRDGDQMHGVIREETDGVKVPRLVRAALVSVEIELARRRSV